jgi:hypothetical protein
MYNQADNLDLATLRAKGGVMLFTIIRLERVYKGMVLLSPLSPNHQRTRMVCMKVYRYQEA